MQETEGYLERAIHKLSHHAAQYTLNMSINKTKIMEFKGKHSITIRCSKYSTFSTWEVIFILTDNESEGKVNTFQLICCITKRNLGKK